MLFNEKLDCDYSTKSLEDDFVLSDPAHDGQ